LVAIEAIRAIRLDRQKKSTDHLRQPAVLAFDPQSVDDEPGVPTLRWCRNTSESQRSIADPVTT
jgi:hypothetical protein